MADQKKSPKKTFEINDDQSINREYANYVTVTTQLHECNLTFCKIDPLYNTKSKVVANVVAKISLPNSMVPEVLDVISKNYNKNIKKFKEKTEEKANKK